MSQMNYREIYNSWLMIDQEHNNHAIIHADRFITPLHVSKVISESEMESMKHEIDNVDKNRKLFLEILPSKGETGVKTMIEIMTNNYDCELLDYFKQARGIKIVPNKIWGDVPKRNLRFINRQRVTENVQLVFSKTVNNNNHSCAVVICGMGGVGKTQIAAQFLYENEDKYKTAFWIKSETISEELLQIDEDFKLNVKDGEQFVKKMKIWFGQFCTPCLLVFDDAEKIDQIERYLPPKGCHILITSRNNNWPISQVDRCFPLDVFSDEEAKNYMQNMFAQKMTLDDMDLIRLTSMLGHLPLALSQACTYIEECCWQISDYIKDLEKQLKLSTTLEISTVLSAVFATWSITQEAIKNKSPVADRLLSICAYLQPDAIPTFLLKDAVGLLDIPLNEDEDSEFSKAMQTLTQFSLLNHTEKQNQVSIHCLLQAAIRHQQRSEEKRNLTLLTRSLIFSYPEERTMTDIRNKRQLLPHLSEAAKIVNGWNDSQPEDKLQVELIMQLLEKNADAFYEMGITKEEVNLLESVLKMKTDQFNFDHPDVASTLVNLGNAYESLGDIKKAKELFKRALVIQEEHFGPDHPQVAVTVGNLGNAYESLGDTKKAKELLERALVIQEKHFGADHPQVAVTLGNLGNAYKSLGGTKKAKELLERSLVIQEEHFGPDHPQVASTLVNLGNAYESLGKTKKAKELLERSLVIQEEHFGPDHAEVASTLVNLGNAYESLGDTKKAKELFKRALVIQEEHFGPDHPQVAVTVGNLGNAYESLGDTKKAKELLERALVIQEKHFGPDHPQVAVTLGNLGNAYKSLGGTKKAKELLERSLVIQEEHFGPDHPQVASTLVNLGNAYESLGKTKKAKELLERSLVIQEEHFGPDHAEVASTLVNLGNAYESLGDTKKAKELFKRALVIQEEHFGPDHPQVAVTVGNLGNAYESLGDMKKAKELLERALVIKEEHFGPDHPEVAVTLGNLGIAYELLGDKKKAKELLERSLVIQEEHFGPDRPQVAVTLGNLGNAYKSLGDMKKAKELLERALVIQEEHFGPDHPQVAVIVCNLGNAYKSLGDTRKAKELLERALVIKEEHFGPDHPQVAVTLGNLGIAYELLGDKKKAKELLERSLVIQEEHFGPDHPQVAVTVGNLGNAYKALGDTKKAKELLERALLIEEEHFGLDHPEVAVTLGNLGIAYELLGDKKKAKELIERSLVIQEEHFGPDHPQVAVTVGNLGNVYKSLGDTKKAKELLERALVIEEEHFVSDHPEVAVTVGNFGNALLLSVEDEEMKRKRKTNDTLTDETNSLSLENDGDNDSKYGAAVSVHQVQPYIWSPYPGLNIDPAAFGSGRFASVHIGNYKNKTRAIKRFFVYSQDNVDALNEEFHTISQLKEHENLVSYVDIVDDNINKALYLIMEFVDGCTLQKYCNPDEKTTRLDLEKKLWISECCWTGLEYLHDNNILHSDISPNNILVSLDLANVKICDFGLSQSKEEMMKTTYSYHHHGTGWFRSPELLQGRRHPIYSDVFSMAATLCEFFSETRLWNVKYIDEWLVIWSQQAKAGLPFEPDCFSKIPENVQNILRDAISPDYKKRPTSSDVLKRTKTAQALEKQKLRKENSC